MKMRLIITFLLIFIKNNVCEESNESKYIDLLPEEEKEQFLQKIARRIFEEAEVSDDRYKQSREMTDDQLNEHTDFVEKILREESANLRKQNRDERGTEDNSEDSIRVKPLLKDKISGYRDYDEKRDVDLTVRQGSRKKKRDNLNVDIEHSTERKIDVYVKYDTVENKVVGKNSSSLTDVQRHENSEEFVNKGDQSSFEDIQVKYFNTKHEAINKKSDEATSTTTKLQIIQITNINNESVEKKTKELTTVKPTSENTENSHYDMSEKVETSSQQFTESIDEPITRNGIEVEFVTEETTIKTPTTVETLSIVSTDTQQGKDTKRVLRSDLHDIPTVTLISDRTYDSKENMEDTTHNDMYLKQNTPDKHRNSTEFKDNAVNTEYSHEIRDQLKETTINNQVDQNTTNLDDNTKSSANILNPNVYIITAETTINNDQKENLLHKENNESKHEDTEIDNKNFEVTTIKSKVTKDRSVMNEGAGDVVKALRQRLLGHSYKYNYTELKTKLDKYDEEDSINKLKPSYNVYELPNIQEPFGIKRIIGNYKNQEQPQYVPIYDYSPNNAYFNAENRYGPNLNDNLEERDSDIDFHELDRQGDIYLSKENFGTLRDRDSNRKFRFGNKGSPKRTHKISQTMIPVVNQKPPFLEDIINPDDYLDTDYYYGRTNTHFKDQRQDNNKKLSDSYEETHPSLDKIKDHIRSVRKILFQNQIFGYIPVNGSVGVTPPQKVLKVTHTPPYKYLKRKSDKNIPRNYYFGRMKTIDDEYENVGKNTKVGYVKHNNFIQDLYVTEDISEILMKKVNLIKFAGQLFFRDDTISNMTNVVSLRNKTKIFSYNESTEYYDTINKVLKLTNEVDLFTTLEKMHNIKIPYTRTGIFQNVSLYLKVLDDILTTDNKSFIQYDWLSTTVDIQSALRRLIDMTEAVQNKIVIHPADLGLLKYVAYLFQTAKTKLYLELELGETNLSRMSLILPRNRKRKKMFLKEKGLLNRVWLFKRENMIESGVLNEFNTFLYELQSALFDLHNAIKHIALVTKYTNQAWFKHLRRIYLTNHKKHLLEVALHLTATRLFGLIEESAITGVEMNIVHFVRNNEKQVERSIDECVFLLRLLNEIKQMES